MSADAYVPATRLRPPPSLSSHTSDAVARRTLRRQHIAALRPGRTVHIVGDDGGPSVSSLAVGGSAGHPGVGSTAASRMTRAFALASQAAALDANDGHLLGIPDNALDSGDISGGAGIDGAPWLDEERFEDWQRPTLDVLRPEIRVAMEDELFPVAVAEDGETLPSELHPSHPYGDLHLPHLGRKGVASHASSQVTALQHKDSHASWKGPRSRGRQGPVSLPPGPPLSDRALAHARQMTGPNRTHWPFCRFGPGQGGLEAFTRAEANRPWRPYRPIWADHDLEGLARLHPGLTRDPLDGQRQQQKARMQRTSLRRGAAVPSLRTRRGRDKQRMSTDVPSALADEERNITALWRPSGPTSLVDEIDALDPSDDELAPGDQ